MARPLPRHPVPMVPWRGAVRRARRSLALRWLVVAAAAALVSLEAARIGGAAAADRAAWGSPVPVVVASRTLVAGDVVGRDDVDVERRPLAVVPEGALSDPPLGRTITATVVAGEVVVDARVAPGGIGGVAALVPDGWRAVAVPTSASGFGTPSPPLSIGDRVDILAPDVVAEAAVVVAITDDAVTVAVDADDAPAVADAVTNAVITLALRGGG